tara:strand:- start:316 stop:564 length:249 start_codon:yes stop_codon:yes gene_type:complete
MLGLIAEGGGDITTVLPLDLISESELVTVLTSVTAKALSKYKKHKQVQIKIYRNFLHQHLVIKFVLYCHVRHKYVYPLPYNN